jgi:hypothetical protein
MSRFAHFLITRFNCGLYGSPQRDKQGRFLIPEDWMKDRFELFERYCLPSVAAQLVQDFQWLVLFDAATPRCHLPRIRSYCKHFPLFVPLWVQTNGDWARKRILLSCRSYIINHLRPGTSHVITTRLDSDDALGRRAIGYVQSCFRGQDSRVVSFVHGYRLRGRELCRVRDAVNPFISLIERAADGLATIYLRSNNEWSDVLPIESDPTWLEVIHGSNLFNRMSRHDKRVYMARLGQDFSATLGTGHSGDVRSTAKDASTSGRCSAPTGTALPAFEPHPGG